MGRGGGRGGGIDIDRLLVGPWGGSKSHFHNYWRSCLAPTAPPPCCYICYMYLYALNSVLKGGPFIVHRTDCQTTAP